MIANPTTAHFPWQSNHKYFSHVATTPMMCQSSGPAMNSLVGHFLILAGAAASICGLSFFVGWPLSTPPDETAASATVAQPTTNDPNTPRPLAQVLNVPIPKDVATLTKAIQRELKRVGCYHGQLDGRWDARSRLAMKTFIDYVNAKLPVDRPDYVLLRLAQAHQGKACGATESKTLQPASPSLLYEGRVRSPTGKVD